MQALHEIRGNDTTRMKVREQRGWQPLQEGRCLRSG